MDYEQWKQFAKKMRPQTRPITYKLIKTCLSNQFCDNCKMRCGCPYRINFYLDEQYFELTLQTAELQALSVIKKITGQEVSDEITNHLNMGFRVKRIRELYCHTFFSYE